MGGSIYIEKFKFFYKASRIVIPASAPESIAARLRGKGLLCAASGAMDAGSSPA